MQCAVDDVDDRGIHPSFPWEKWGGRRVRCCFALVGLDERSLGPQKAPNPKSTTLSMFHNAQIVTRTEHTHIREQ